VPAGVELSAAPTTSQEDPVETLTSPDGTSIAYQVTGTGPPLVLVVGAFCDRETTAELAALLADDFTVVEYDRRGRGASGDTGPYAPEREVEDLHAVLAAAGGTPYVYGHSSGAVLALEAAAAGAPVRALVVYEPPYSAEGDPGGRSEELLEQVRERVGAGDRDGAAAAFLGGAGAPDEVVAMMRSGPGWPRMCALAPTLVYDLTLTNGGLVPVERLSRIGVPTLVLAGGASPPWAERSAAAVVAAVPGARSEVVAGAHHGVAAAAVAPVIREAFRA
jgi:pimeloyl-ACP methyl ester carboxylesterase